MGNSPVSRWLAAAALLACTAIVPAAAQDAPDPATLPAGAAAEYDRVLQDEFCGCGSPHSLGQCLKSHSECRHSRRLAQIAALEAARGVTSSEIGVELARDDQGFRDARTAFKVDERQCRGKGPVTLVEFSDFECPHCAVLRPVLEKFATDNASKVKLCWMSFPLSQHPNSMPAAQATLLARDKGKLWAVHDALFENQRRLSYVTVAREQHEQAAIACLGKIRDHLNDCGKMRGCICIGCGNVCRNCDDGLCRVVERRRE